MSAEIGRVASPVDRGAGTVNEMEPTQKPGRVDEDDDRSGRIARLISARWGRTA